MTTPSRYEVLNRAVQLTTDLSQKHKAFRIMEVGVHKAERAIQMIRAATAAGRTHVDYFGYDLFSTWTPEVNQLEIGKAAPPLSVAETISKIQDHTKVKTVALSEGNSRETLIGVSVTIPRVNIAFIDGGHSLETVQSDIANVLPAIAQGGILVLDDYYENNQAAGCGPALASLPAGWVWAVAAERDVFPGTVGAVRCVVAGTNAERVKSVANVSEIGIHHYTQRDAVTIDPSDVGSIDTLVAAGLLTPCGDDRPDLLSLGVRGEDLPIPVADATGSDHLSCGRRFTGLELAGDMAVGAEGQTNAAVLPPVSEEREESDTFVEPRPYDGPDV